MPNFAKLEKNLDEKCCLMLQYSSDKDISHQVRSLTMPAVTKGIRCFLANQKNLPGADLIERFLEYGPENLETQVNVARGDGDPVEGRRNTWTDGDCSWFNIRIPKNANSKPEWNDYELRWAPEEHAEAIGSTGWDWQALRSRWVGYDFDDITGHAQGVGINDADLIRVAEAAKALPYVEVRKSTGGRGLHLYVLFDEKGIPTANHTEHAAVARCILGMMTADVGFNFANAIDACGHNMWIWRRDISQENQGLLLQKPATKTLSVNDLPTNWRDHIAVVTRRATKIKLQGVDDKNRDPFDDLASARRIIHLDDKHKAIIEALMETGFSTVWVPDHHLLQAHTKALAKLMEDPEIRSELNLVGHFQTSSQGKNPGQPNCFLFPTDDGGWRVYRFSQGVAEASTWIQDGSGWTTCYFNRLPDIETACRANGGQRVEGKPHYIFPDGHHAIKAAEALGQQLDLDMNLRDRTVELRVNNGYLTVYLKRTKKDDEKDMKGWVEKRSHWVRDLDKRLTPEDTSDIGDIDYDNFLRSLRSPAGEVAGWRYTTMQGDWSGTPGSMVKLILQGKGQIRSDAEVIMGRCALNPWKIVCQPFHDEYPGGRRWNMKAPQLCYTPAQLSDDEQPHHPHWDLILNHIGTEITPAIQKHGWARKHGITTGAQYLLLWIAAMIREPFQRAPFLFLHGNENCGKSIFYEAVDLLMTKGVVNASKAVATTGDFNGELVGAVLCYIEEIDLSHHKVALPRIKDWTMAENILIRQMRTDAYLQPNTTHWVQVANHRDYCPIWSGDTRITSIKVPDLLPEQEVKKIEMLQQLRSEAPHFLYTLLNAHIPPAAGRLCIPIIETESKLEAIETTRTSLDDFVAAYCEPAEGERVNFAVLYDAFIKWLPTSEQANWTAQKVSKGINWDRRRGKSGRYFENMVLQNDPVKVENEP